MGARTFSAVRSANFVGPGTKLSDTDLPRIGALINVGEDEIHAVLEVETRGGGYNPLNQPKILFEPHVFYRNLSGSELDRAVSQGLAYAKWRSGNYGAESVQYTKLFRAMVINETAALKACSWGLGQILGENFVAAGFSNVQAMVVDAVDGGEAAQLQQMINFIQHNHLDDELRSHNWAGFARGYNGSQYAVNDYHNKLLRAFEKWQRIADTPYVKGSTVQETKPVTVPQAVETSIKPVPTAVVVQGSIWSKLGTILSGLFVKH